MISDVKVGSFNLSQSEINGKVGDSVVVNITDILPDNATDKTINVSVENGSFASFNKTGDNQYTFNLTQEGATNAHFDSKDGGKSVIIPINVTAQ